ncbi:MAG: hypothetical protein SFV32_05280 [Opitutaceae bacterium]|nr:hypothetical protein [Opitutaceae bacterium]
MRKWLNNPWFVGLLACFALAFCVWSLRDQLGLHALGGAAEATPVATDETSSTADAPSVAVAQAVALGNIREIFPVGRSSEEEPAAPTAEVTEKSETFVLSAVWSQGPIVIAVINGRECIAGDALGSVTIESVSTDGVWLQHWKGRRFLNLGQSLSLTTLKAPPATLATQS